MDLKELRKKITQIDKRILKQLNQRARLNIKIGKLKKKTEEPVFSPERQHQLVNLLCKENKGPLKNEDIENIYTQIFSSSLVLQKPFKVAYLGPEATFTHLAALKKFGKSVQYVSCKDITEVFTIVDRGQVDYGIVPIENSIEGAVSHTMDLLIDVEVKICAEIILSVEHHLMVGSGTKNIKKIYSHPQVFPQCRGWLEKNYPLIEKIEVKSTAEAAEISKKERGSACIGSKVAADYYNLKIVHKNIQDFLYNKTRFLVIGKHIANSTGHDKTSLVFSIKDKAGALHDMLVPFKTRQINLTRIESRPSKKRAWDYYFFVDLEGHVSNSSVREAIDDLAEKCVFVKILGSYPGGRVNE